MARRGPPRKARSDADRQFPNAIRPDLWYSHPPIAPGPRAIFPDTRLGGLEPDIRTKVYGFIGRSQYDWDMTQGHLNRRRTLGNRPKLDGQQPLTNLRNTCQQLREEVNEHFSHSTVHISYDSKTIIGLCQQIGTHHVAQIRFLKLHINDAFRVYHQGLFPGILELLCDNMPALRRFQLYASYAPNDSEYMVANPTDQQVDQYKHAARALLRFAAFLVLRHTDLDLLVWPWDADKHVPDA